MAVHISKVFDTLRIRFLPLLLKVVKTITYRIIPKIAMILFFMQSVLSALLKVDDNGSPFHCCILLFLPVRLRQ